MLLHHGANQTDVESLNTVSLTCRLDIQTLELRSGFGNAQTPNWEVVVERLQSRGVRRARIVRCKQLVAGATTQRPTARVQETQIVPCMVNIPSADSRMHLQGPHWRGFQSHSIFVVRSSSDGNRRKT